MCRALCSTATATPLRELVMLRTACLRKFRNTHGCLTSPRFVTFHVYSSPSDMFGESLLSPLANAAAIVSLVRAKSPATRIYMDELGVSVNQRQLAKPRDVTGLSMRAVDV